MATPPSDKHVPAAVLSEVVDIVDNEDRVVGTATRGEAHATGLIHRLSAIFLFGHGGRLCVQVRRGSGLLDASVGGHVASGETYREAAQRELGEELGLSVPLLFVATFPVVDGPTVNHQMTLFTGLVPEGWVFEATDEVGVVGFWDLFAVREVVAGSPERFTAGFRGGLLAWDLRVAS